MSLRTRLALVFIAATLIPLGAMVWVTTILLDRSLRLSPVDQGSELSRSLEQTGRQYYLQAREQLKRDALDGKVAPRFYKTNPIGQNQTNPTAARDAGASLPDAVRDFLQSDEAEQFAIAGDGGSELLYLKRTPAGVEVFTRPLLIRMHDLARQYSAARTTVVRNSSGYLRRGF